jgi:catechol 2,3-dioxygenase-like lactoylglutathione lyase family enzyme
MEPRTIHHIGFLVRNLESAIDAWQKVTGFTFQPIVRYRTRLWEDAWNTTPHYSDVRLAFSLEGPPHIELMEFSGTGTHGVERGESVHHLGFADIADVDAQLEHLRSLGIGANGRTLTEDHKTILAFIEPEDFMGVRLEYVGRDPQPVFTDDGRQLRIDERGLAVLADEDE